MNDYRVESGAVYEYRKDRNAYIFLGKLNGRTLRQFIEDINESYYMSELRE